MYEELIVHYFSWDLEANAELCFALLLKDVLFMTKFCNLLASSCMISRPCHGLALSNLGRTVLWAGIGKCRQTGNRNHANFEQLEVLAPN